MSARAPSILVVLVFALAPAACVRVAGSVAKPTAVERQLLGEYDQLDDDLVHSSSVRGGRSGSTTSFDALKTEAIEQRAIQRFNEDDLAELKGEKCIAEALEGRVVERPCLLADRDESARRRLARVVREENRAREAILTWAAYDLARQEGRARPEPAVFAELRKTYERLLREAAAPGHLAEVAPGDFREVER